MLTRQQLLGLSARAADGQSFQRRLALAIALERPRLIRPTAYAQASAPLASPAPSSDPTPSTQSGSSRGDE